MLEVFQSLREELTSKKQVEVDQPSTPKPGILILIRLL